MLCCGVLGQQDQCPGLVQSSYYSIFVWSGAKVEGSRQISSPAGSSTPSRREKQRCGEASADNWKILAKLRRFNNRWWGKGLASSLSIILQCRRSLHMTSCSVVSDLLLNGPHGARVLLPSSGNIFVGSGFDFPSCLAEPSHLCGVLKVETFNSSPSTAKGPVQTSTQMQEHRSAATVYQALYLLLPLLYKTKVLCKVRCQALGFASLCQHLEKTSTKEKGDKRRTTVIIFLWAQAPSCSMILHGSACYRLRDEKTLKSCVWKERSCNGTTSCPSVHKQVMAGERIPPGSGHGDQCLCQDASRTLTYAPHKSSPKSQAFIKIFELKMAKGHWKWAGTGSWSVRDALGRKWSLFNLQRTLLALAVSDRFTGQSKVWDILKYWPLKTTLIHR